MEDIKFRAFLNNVIDGGTVAGDVNSIRLPLSFAVPLDYDFTFDINKDEKMLATWGLNIYDGACWEISLWLLKDTNSSVLDQIRISCRTTQFLNTINTTKDFQQVTPLSVSENTIPSGPIDPTHRGLVYNSIEYTFRMISNYYSYNPSSIQPEQWSTKAKYWNDFRPISGENAWFYGISPFLRNIDVVNYKGFKGFLSALFSMMDANGGFYYSPIDSMSTNWSFSTENNASMYGALSHIKSYLQSNPSLNIGITCGQLTTMMNGIVKYYESITDKHNYFFYHGKTWNGSQWENNIGGVRADLSSPYGVKSFTVTTNDVNMPNGSSKAYVLAVDVITWSICSLQPSIIDSIFGEPGASLKMWYNLKQTCGRFNKEGKLQGFGYTNIKPSFDVGMGTVISAEWTFGAMMACKVLIAYYGEATDIAPYTVSSDLAEMESFIYTPNSGVIGDNHLLFISDSKSYFNYANTRAQTGFGWYSNPFGSTTSTSWHLFYSKSFNPFVPNGAILR